MSSDISFILSSRAFASSGLVSELIRPFPSSPSYCLLIRWEKSSISTLLIYSKRIKVCLEDEMSYQEDVEESPEYTEGG